MSDYARAISSGKGGGGKSFLQSIAQSVANASKRQSLSIQDVLNNSPLKKPEKDPYELMMDQLQQQINGIQASDYLTPLEQLQRQAQNQSAAQYDPQIKALEGQMEQTTVRGNNNIKEAKAMYGSLAKDIAAQLPGITNEMRQTADEVKARYGGAGEELEENYDEQAAQQSAVLKQLGVQAAAPEANKEQNADEAYFEAQMGQDQQQTLDALAQIQAGAEQYNQQSSNNANLAGNNAAQDIRGQLEEFLQQAGSQMAALQSGKESTASALLAQLQGADQQRAEDTAQKTMDRIMQLANFQLKAKKDFADMSGDNQSAFKGTTGLSGATRYLAEAYPNNPKRASELSSLVASILGSDAATSGRQTVKDPLTGQPTSAPITDNYIIKKIREKAAASGYQDVDINNAVDAYYAMQGKLR